MSKAQLSYKELHERADSIGKQLTILERKMRKKNRPEDPLYENVIRVADEFMGEGRAISSGVLARSMGLDKSQEKVVKGYMDKAVDEGKYEVRKEPMYAFKVMFSVYSPKGKDLPYLPSNMSMKDYDSLVEGSLGLIYGLPSRFTQQKFHDGLKGLGKQKGIDARGATMSVPSILRTYVKKGILDTKDGNTYRKNRGKV